MPGNAAIGHQIRMQMLHTLVDNKDYVLKPKHWSPEINENRQDLFLDITSRSKFTLCPRGYGASSFRMYEAMQLNLLVSKGIGKEIKRIPTDSPAADPRLTPGTTD